MFRFKSILVFAFILFTCNVVAEDVYISGGDDAALQAAIDAANVPGSQVTIHLEAGQFFDDIPHFSKIEGNITVEGNGAIWGNGHTFNNGLASVLPDGALTITGVTIVGLEAQALNCWAIHNQGSLTLERVTINGFVLQPIHNFFPPGCIYPREMLLNEGFAELVNVTIVGGEFPNIGHYLIYTSENASTEISHMTAADHRVTYSWESGGLPDSILFTEPGGSTSISNSIVLANANLEDRVVPCVGPITDNGGNFASSDDCGFSSDLIGRSSLGQIFEKGHDAWVFPLLADSIAINGGDPARCEKLDGRGFERKAVCDSGAYEYSASNHSGELGRGGISGFYYTPENNGNYIQVQRVYDGNVVVIWNTFDTSGSQAWFNALGSYENGVVNATAWRNIGGKFQPGSGASGATEIDWGTIKVTAHNCNQITVEYDSIDPEFGSGSFDAQRIAFVHDLGCSEN